MKPTTITNKNARNFPFVDFQYQTSNLENFTGTCIKTSKSLRDISRDYFDSEANHDFLIDAVKRGPMVRQVRGLGTLVPEEFRWLPTTTEASVEKILIWPGTKVEPSDVILELTSPELEQSAHEAESKAKAAEAELATEKATLQRETLDQESKAAAAHSAYEQARMERQTNDQLAKNGLVADLVYKTSKIKEAECQKSDEIESKRLAFSRDSIEPQLAAKQAAVDQANQLAKLKF